LKKKNVDIASLRKQLKLPATEDSQEKEVDETEGHKEEMLKLIMEQNAQIREMEAEMDKLIKEKKQSVQMAIIPLEAVPLTGVRTTEEATTTEIPSTIPMQVPDASEKIVKSMEDMSLQGEEIRKLQEEVKNLQDLKSMFSPVIMQKCISLRDSVNNYNSCRRRLSWKRPYLRPRKTSGWISTSLWQKYGHSYRSSLNNMNWYRRPEKQLGK
jgi:hypothetical protein